MSKSNYICAVPFQAIELHDKKRFLCCASWLTKFLPEEVPIDEAWKSTEADDIRDSILDGSYKYCDDKQCPFLNEAAKPTTNGKLKPLYLKSELPRDLKKDIKNYKEGKLDMNKEMVLFCAGGLRSALAVKSLKEMGFEKVSHIDGGFAAISQSDFKIV